MSHIHLYRVFPMTQPLHFVGCLHNKDVPELEVGSTVEYEGEVYSALPVWKGNAVVVQRDDRQAQVATPQIPEPDVDYELTKQRLLVGAGEQTA